MKRHFLLVSPAYLLLAGTVAWMASCSGTNEFAPMLTTSLDATMSADSADEPPPRQEASEDDGADSAQTGDETMPMEATVIAPQDVATDSPPEAGRDDSSTGDAALEEAGGACASPSECSSGVCGTTGACEAPSCSDGVKNGDETDVDCGGPKCSACTSGHHCEQARDCVDKVCTYVADGGMTVADDGGAIGTCQAPSCTDGVENGTETDVDCGGSCPPCGVGEGCNVAQDCTSASCSGMGGDCQCPTGMVEIFEASTKSDYCIDAIETTKAQYYAFYQDPQKPTPIAVCASNASYTPSAEFPPTLTSTGYNGGDPVRGVNWCDAYEYCLSAHKHLCGRIGGGTNPPTSYDDATQSQWYNACSAGGQQAYPYGNTYQPTVLASPPAIPMTEWVCDDIVQPPGPGPGHTAPFVFPQTDSSGNLNIPQILNCNGGASGLYDMSGDVAEWEDSCDGNTGPADNCLVRGGSYNAQQDPSLLRCDTQATFARSTLDASIGFRCCL